MDLAEETACDLRKKEKKFCPDRRSAIRHVDLSRKPGFLTTHRGFDDQRFGITLAVSLLLRPGGSVGHFFNLARRSMMALEKLATAALRPQQIWRIVTAAVVALTTVGCGQHRQSYRPIYTTPPVSAPCTNCGPGTTTTTDDSGLPPAAAEPALPGSAGTDSSVPPLSGPSGTSAAPTRRSTVERPPNSRIDEEPGLNDVASPPASSGVGKPSPSARPSNSNLRPSLEGPSSSPSTPNTGASDGRQTGASPPKLVRNASLKERLRPFLDDAGVNELYYPNKADRPWRYIVLHHSAAATGNYDQIDREHRKILGFDGCGYHFVIGNGSASNDGQIEIAQRWNNQKQGVHCRNARTPEIDEYGIGICLVGDFEQEPPTPRQIAATQALIAFLSQRYKISQTRVTTHAHLAATPTICPGKYFPAESIVAGATDAPSRRAYRTTWTAVRETSRTK
jgi:hypothetical protein